MENVDLSSHEFIYVVSCLSYPTWEKSSLGENVLQHPGFIKLEENQTWEGTTVMTLPRRTLKVLTFAST